MARRSARGDSPDDERSSRRRPAKSGPPMALILLLVGLMVGVVVVARWIASRPKADEVVKEVKQASDIYSDLPVEQPPTYTPGKAPKRMLDKAPPGIADAAIFQEARLIAKQAADLLDEAKQAKTAQDHGTWNEKGLKAKELYDKAIMISADWEQGLMDKYGDNDRQVDAIMRERSRWFDMLSILHKTTGR